ncbi:MAG: hypothetical protein BIFFINMI_04272 [Phycisphaerae bacterium]|nr:hypothetical protein [Phycisphaerae bacterium]
MLRTLLPIAAILLALPSAAGCVFRTQADAPHGKVVVTRCAVCRLVWTAAGWKTECPAPTSQPEEGGTP